MLPGCVAMATHALQPARIQTGSALRKISDKKRLYISCINLMIFSNDLLVKIYTFRG